jgi:hypothetical protein
LPNNDKVYNQLKSLLLGDELARIDKLESLYKPKYFQDQKDEEIIDRMLPLFDTMLLSRLQNRDEETKEILSKHMAEILTKTSKIDGVNLTTAMQSVVSPAISDEIANNKEKMVDTLYPIMGGMISKYVTQAIKEMLETINEKVEDGLSLDKYKRKIKAKISGVSESELLLEESGDAVISSLFVIQKSSGLLISEAHLKDKQIDDPHMVASMASAIRDFINDWTQNNKTNNEVQILSYGNATLYIESAGSVYVVAFLNSEPDHEQRKDINVFFATLVEEYSEFFQNFDGDDSHEDVKSLCVKMDDFLNEDSNALIKKDEDNTSKYFMYFISFILGAYFISLCYGWFTNYNLERIVYNQTEQRIDVTSENDTLILEGYVGSKNDLYAIENIVKNESSMEIDNKLMLPATALNEIIKQDRLEFIQETNILREKIISLEKQLHAK